MRNSIASTNSENLSNTSQEQIEQPPAKRIVLRRISAAELALKVRLGELGNLKPCCYNPSSNSLKMLPLQ